MSDENTEFDKEYTEEGFWQKIKRYGKMAGREVVVLALTLYFCLVDSDTPTRVKAQIVGALGYFILPIDVIPDFTPIIGFSDDLAIMLVVAKAIHDHIKPAHRAEALAKWEDWFGDEKIADDATEAGDVA